MEEQTSTASFLEQAKQEREAMEKALAQIRQERKEFEELRAREILGGTTQAGQTQKPQESNPKDYAQAALKGKII